MRLRPTTLAALGTVLTLAVAVPSVGAGAAAPSAPAAAKATTTTVAAVSASAGKAVTVSASVSPNPGGGSVAFRNGSTTVCAKATVRSGKATCSVTFTAGKHTVTAKYSGRSGAYAASTGSRTLTVAAASGSVVGSVGACTTTKGALAAVDFAHWSGPIVRGCGTTLTTGRGLLTSAGFSITNVQRFPGFICRLGHALFNSGAQYPTSAQDPCVNTPPSSAYWSFWTAAKGATTWTYSPNGADSDAPANGEVEAWTFGSTDINGTTGKPTFTPAQVRAGLPAGTVAGSAPAAVPAAARTPDQASATAYLVRQLTGGTHYEQFGAPDYGLTIDGAFALAAAGGQDDHLAAVVDYLAQHVDGYTLLTTAPAFASGGSVAKLALAAEVAGRDPRAFGSTNLISALHRLTCTKASTTNQCAGKGNYAYSPSIFSQSLGVLAQLRAGDGAAAAAPIAFLQKQQYASGAFPSTLPASSSAPEVDSTAMAAMALALVPGTSARTQLAKALAWLASRQKSDGGFPGAAGNSTNSAALAVQALRLDAAKYATSISHAETFLAARQNSDGGFTLATGSSGSDLRASTQATSGAVGTPFGTVLRSLPARTAATTGAGYLVGQLTDGNHYVTSFGGQNYDDQGLTADGLFALLAAGGHDATVAAMRDYLAGQVGAYADPDGQAGGPYSGALAKLAIVAEATGGNPHAFGGTDLLKLIVSKVCTAAIAGDFSPCTAKGDLYNAFSTTSQALGVLALDASSVSGDHLASTSPVVVRLHQLQCSDGGFSSTLIAPGAACTSDVDTTGFAVQALTTVPGTDAWLGKAQAYLTSVQRSSGLFPGTAGDNSNSTALAAQALQALTAASTSLAPTAPGPKTIAPIVGLQSALSGLASLAVSGGGFAKTAGGSADLRASTQAVAAAAQVSLLQLSGAALRSTPRTAPITSSPGGGTSSASTSGAPTSSAGAGASGASGSSGAAGLAATGNETGQQLAIALLLLVGGAGLTWLGRRRIPGLAGRHRVGGRHT